MTDQLVSSPLIPPPPITHPTAIDLEAGSSDQIQCRICLETDGNFTFSFLFSVFRFKFLVSRLGLFSLVYAICDFMLYAFTLVRSEEHFIVI